VRPRSVLRSATQKIEARFPLRKRDSCLFGSVPSEACFRGRFKEKCARFKGDTHLQGKVQFFFLIFGIWVGPSLSLGLREKNEENKRALSPLFSSFFHLELGGESLEERAKERLRVQICENL
jgi:hypothetical protein